MSQAAALHPIAGKDYPRNLPEFLERFSDEAGCALYLGRLRWPEGFSCPRCGTSECWLSRRGLFICAECHHQTSVRVGTVFERSRVPLTSWFQAIWLVASQKDGMSALSLKRQLGLSSYETAWTMLHKLRTAMVRPEREKLQGEIEVDEMFVGGATKGGKHGRGAEGKEIVLIAVERAGSSPGRRRRGRARRRFGLKGPLGRVRMMMVDDTRRKTLHDFISSVCEPGSVIYTDGYRNYEGLEGLGYTHIATNISKSDQEAHELMPGVHRVASLLKRWLLGTHQGGFQRQHLDSYLDEFTFRFNRRRSSHPGLLFYRLISQAVKTRPISYETIVWSRAGLRKPPEATLEDIADADEAPAFLLADDEAIPF